MHFHFGPSEKIRLGLYLVYEALALENVRNKLIEPGGDNMKYCGRRYTKHFPCGHFTFRINQMQDESARH